MKNDLKRVLSRLEGFENPRIDLEQYLTPSELASDVVFTAYMQGDIEGKDVIDLGSGTGILGIGAAILGGNVSALEKDEDAFNIAKKNAKVAGVDLDFMLKDVGEVEKDFDTVVMNPPFSVHSDVGLSFWDNALESSSAVYGICPRGARDSIKSLVRSSSHRVEGVQEYEIGLPPSYGFHTEESRKTSVDLIVTRREELDNNGT